MSRLAGHVTALAVLAMLCLQSVWAQDDVSSLQQVRVKQLDDRTRVVLDLSAPSGYRVFSLEYPTRTVVDLAKTLVQPGATKSSAGGVVTGVRSGARSSGGLRVVLDLTRPSRAEFFTLTPSGSRGHRLVVDLFPASAIAAAVPVSGSSNRSAMTATVVRKSEIVVAIDPGHGGRDPGAIGPTGVLERDLTLAVANRLRKLVDAEPNMRAVMIRSDNRYVSLRTRIDKAHRNNADLFISIHADSFRDKRAKGSSVYVLSERGASSEAARWLAMRENAADLVGGATLDGVDKDIRSVVLSMVQEHTIGDSWRLASAILANLRQVGTVHKPTVERAGFVVLKSPDIPSVLVELAFITNPREEAKMKTPLHQDKLAAAIMAGVRRYVRIRMPRLAAVDRQTHLVKRGETLGGIARRYSVSMADLRSVNGIRGDRLSAGAKLKIPGG